MNCKEIKNFIIECDGKLEKLKATSEVLSQIKSHIASCKDCATAQSRMAALASKIVAEKINIPAGLCDDIIKKVIPEKSRAAAENSKPEETTGWIERIAAILGMTRERFSFALSVAAITIVAGLIFVAKSHFTADQNAKIAKNEEPGAQNTPAIVKPVENKFKKNETTNINTAKAPDKTESKFKKAIFTIESGALASLEKEPELNILYEAVGKTDLKIIYKSAAVINLKVNSKFKVTDDGLDLTEGLAQVDLTPKTLNRFCVATPESIVTVTGTKFSVCRENHKTEVAVQNGSVKVLDTESKETVILGAGESKTIINKKIRKPESDSGLATAPVEILSQTSEVALKEQATAEIKLKSTNINNLINELKNDDITQPENSGK